MIDTTTLSDSSTPDGWDTRPRPWRRYLARTFDNAVIGTVLWFLIATVTYVVSLAAGDHLVAFMSSIYWRLLHGTINLALMIPIQAAMISLTGGSPGKWLCGVRVRNLNGTRLGFRTALYREVKIWLLGFGAGLPVISLVALIRAYQAVMDTGTAEWDDADERVVACLSARGGRQVLIGLAIVVTVLITGWGLVDRLSTTFGQV